MIKHPTPRLWYNTQLARWLAVALWMGVIFAFSAQPHLPSLPKALFDFLLKKGAHFSVYAVLAVLIWRALEWRGRGWAWAWLLAVLYAISDEYHQSFVANRHPQATDVLIDACGAATALLIVALLLQRSKKQTESVISSPLSVVDE
jgi:VanZ family protein